MTKFKELNLKPEILKSLDDLGFEQPSPIQEKAIPFILKSKKDLIALAQTGTGKTAAFSLPILNQIDAKEKNLVSIILCPTRELCIQISKDIESFTKYTKNISSTPVYGGARIDLQIRAIKQGVNIVVGTPGRVHDLIRRKVLKLQNIKYLVLDEADEMLDMGFKEDLDAILSETPKNRKTLLFSATISKSVHAIAQQYMNDAQEISVGAKNIGADQVSHEYYVISAKDRFDALKRVLDYLPGIYGIIFCRTRMETQTVAEKLKKSGYVTEALHGDIAQNARTKIMDSFRQRHIKLLVATDVAARGIDVNDISHVINYNLPDQNEIYTHRSGRTGRANKSGVAISLITPRDISRIKRLESVVSKKINYKKIPNGEEIYFKRIDSFLQDLEGVAETSQKGLDEVRDKLSKKSKEQLIEYVISSNLNDLAEVRQDKRNLNADLSSRGRRSSGGRSRGRGGDRRSQYADRRKSGGDKKPSRGYQGKRKPRTRFKKSK